MNPYKGEPMPFRNNWTNIVSNGPFNKIPVPKNVLVWNPFSQTWSNGEDENNTAYTKITMTPLYSKWHNGIPMDRYDLLYSSYFPYEWAIDTKNNDRTYDAEYSSLTLPTLPLNKGIRFNEDNTFESYVDLWHYDKKQLPQYGAVWASEPWEITAATERLVANNKLSYSKSDSNIKQNEQLSLILPTHSELIKQELEKMKQEKFIPNPLKGLVSLDYVMKRYDSSIQWIDVHHNSEIGNGPYYLDSFNPSGGVITLKKFNDSTYPYKKGYFSKFENNQQIKINKINIPKFIRIGEPFKFDIEIVYKGDISKTKKLNETVNYFVSDRSNNVVIHNVVNNSNYSRLNDIHYSMQNNASDTSNQISLQIDPDKTKQLSIGPAKLKLFVTSETSQRPIIYEYVLIVIP
jgi:peptide/nickel transport system substrate-binding protein